MSELKLNYLFNIYYNNDSTSNPFIHVYDNTIGNIYFNADCSNFFNLQTKLILNLDQNDVLPYFDKVTNISSMFNLCSNIYGSPKSGNNVIDMSYSYCDCVNITGNPICSPNVINMRSAYNNCRNLSGNPICGFKVDDYSYAYYNCISMTGLPVCGPNVINMSYAYSKCNSLIGYPVCGVNVINMCGAYMDCTTLTGSPISCTTVTDMSFAYVNCTNLIGSVPVSYAANMNSTYLNCVNLTGNPYIDMNVKNLDYTFSGCINLSGSIDLISGSTLESISHSFENCPNIYGRLNYNCTTYKSNDSWSGCFYKHNNTNLINLFITNYDTFNEVYNYTNLYSLVGNTVTWTSVNLNCFYSTIDNVWVGTGDCDFIDHDTPIISRERYNMNISIIPWYTGNYNIYNGETLVGYYDNDLVYHSVQ